MTVELERGVSAEGNDVVVGRDMELGFELLVGLRWKGGWPREGGPKPNG